MLLKFFETAYRAGYTPWDREATTMRARLQALLDDGELRAPGRGLDIGCGTGRHTLFLAERGWTMTGIDFSAQALKRATSRPVAQGASVRFVRGDVTQLEACGLGEPFDLLFDSGCFHSLTDGRSGYAAGLRAVATANASYLLLALGPGSDPAQPAGATRAEIESAFTPDWQVVGTEDMPMKSGAMAAFYNFRRRPGA